MRRVIRARLAQITAAMDVPRRAEQCREAGEQARVLARTWIAQSRHIATAAANRALRHGYTAGTWVLATGRRAMARLSTPRMESRNEMAGELARLRDVVRLQQGLLEDMGGHIRRASQSLDAHSKRLMDLQRQIDQLRRGRNAPSSPPRPVPNLPSGETPGDRQVHPERRGAKSYGTEPRQGEVRTLP